MVNPRVLMVTRRYWPHVADDAACRLAALVEGLRRVGVRAEVMAARYAASWPTELMHREALLHRPAAAPKGEWSMARYQRALSNALKRMSGGFDVLYADSMREEGAAVVELARRAGIPSVVRYAGIAEHSDAAWWQRGRAARRARSICLSADVLLATRASAEQALVAAGGDRQRILRIDDGFPAVPPHDAASRRAAIRALSDINADLFVPDRTRVVLCTNRLSEQSGVPLFVDALPPLLQRVPQTRIWIVGDGPWRSRLYDRLRAAGVAQAVAMPGSFSSLDELITAADLYVHPHVADGMEYHLPLALAAALPVVVSGGAEMKRLLGESFSQVSTFASGDAASLAASVEQALLNLPARSEAARPLRQQLLTTRPATATVESYVKLFRKLTTDARSSLSADPSPAESAP